MSVPPISFLPSLSHSPLSHKTPGTHFPKLLPKTDLPSGSVPEESNQDRHAGQFGGGGKEEIAAVEA